ncbi:hypothetical protein OEIGOIKO_00583 [Streptomyces chrestomyceticus JCM 4735]|uniref:Integral membrane protein n=1 Tax=Streptomyces chrestomyceticus JCM 4735 TaxID=1306181 RepID=A0A7U9KP67_9ACTN|nr:hypothetical protein [Streptomyces chrestomyceticus]GCD32865.1 hypothetical protein OEIGOIKO_00583 [Streptomyces chrestomyceticus JCM 4735]
MKIRRALTAAAAAAVLAPVAVMAAPAAFAAEPAPGAGVRTPASAGSTEAENPDKAGPADEGEHKDKDTKPADKTGKGTEAGKDGKVPGTGPAAGAGKAPKGSEGTKGSEGAKGSENTEDQDQTCAFASDQLRVAVDKVPAQLVAGGAWTRFTMTLDNTTGKAMEQVQPFLHVSSSEDVDRPWLELETEYRDSKTGTWKTFQEADTRELFGSFAIGAHKSVTLELRTRVVKNAKPGSGFMLASGDYRNRDGSCGSAKESFTDFKILPAGSKPTQPPATKPGQSGKPGGDAARTGQSGTHGGAGSDGGAGPQGGRLAETGSATALPTVALAGGAAMAVGAGAVFGSRRRRGAAAQGGTDASA